MQLIITSKLSKEINFWLKNLTNDLKETKEMKDLVLEYSKHQKSKLHQSVMNIIVKANREFFRRDHKMCEALIELMQDVMQDELEEQKKIGIDKGIQIGENKKLRELIGKKLSKGKSIEQIAEELEEDRSVIEEIMKGL